MNNLEKNNEKEEFSSKEKLKILKNEIYKDIKNEFQISRETVDKLSKLKNETNSNELKDFKSEIEKSFEINENDKNNILSFTSDKLERLLTTIKGAEKIEEKEFQDKIEIVVLGEDDGISKKISPNFHKKALKPKNYKDEFVGLCLGGFDTCYTSIKLVYDIGNGVVKSPKDIYLIVSGKGYYKNVKRKIFIICLILTIIIITFFVLKILNFL